MQHEPICTDNYLNLHLLYGTCCLQEQISSTNKVHCLANKVQCVTNCFFRTGNKKLLIRGALHLTLVFRGFRVLFPYDAGDGTWAFVPARQVFYY